MGEPSGEEKDRYTRVLKGHVAIATSKFPVKLPGYRLDMLARKSLWDIGLDYNHGTGHGIGHFLNVHEGPHRISYGYSVDDPGLQENMFTSNGNGLVQNLKGFLNHFKTIFQSLATTKMDFMGSESKILSES